VNSHRPINFRVLAVLAGLVAVVFGALAAVAFTRPAQKTTKVSVPYSQHVSFSYHGTAPAGPVYPGGVLSTGDPVFLQLVHQIQVQADYSLVASAPHQVSGTAQLALRLSGPTGWSREQPLGPVKHFTGDHVRVGATLNLASLQSLIKQIQKLTGVPAASGYTIAVVPRVHVNGNVVGQPLLGSFAPVLNFELAATQLRPSVTGGSGRTAGFSPAQPGSVATTASVANRLLSVPVNTLSAVGIGGALLGFLSVVLLVVLIKRTAPFGESGRIKAQFGHLIVPIAGTADDLAWAPFDVPNIDALVRLAEACDRLILHYREDTLDTYLVNDEGTVYRYQSRHTGVVWGEWSSSPVAVRDSVAPPTVQEVPARA
jgi:signal peptidase I